MAEISSFNLSAIKSELRISEAACTERGLLQSAKWAAEVCFSLDVEARLEADIESTSNAESNASQQQFEKEQDRYTLARRYFDLKEYVRAAFFIRDCSHPKVYFLHAYSKYLSQEKKHVDNKIDSIGPPQKQDNDCLKELQVELAKRYHNKDMDGYLLYLYGVVLRKLDLVSEASAVLLEAVNHTPSHWGAWQELAMTVYDRETLFSLSLPKHWIKHLFMAQVYLTLQMNDEALKIYKTFQDQGFADCIYIVAQIALTHHNLRDIELAMESFIKLEDLDTYRLENMDIYSNLLYVKEMRYQLAYLAHKCCDIDKYRVETCCVIGNYYSLRSEHEKAVLYFQRALKLNPHYLSAWTLMGHEYLELKNASAASQAYRHALEVDCRDFRVWYGLGQTYEMLKMPFYCLYYYRQAHKLRPNDSRMIMALGECYEQLDRLQEAKKCFWKAHSVGDIEGIALIKLARLHERLGEEDKAVGLYTEYIYGTITQGTYNAEDQSHAYKYLANYYLKTGQLNEAYAAAQKCSEFTETREEAKVILRQIAHLRTLGEGAQQIPPQLDDQNGSLLGEQFRGPAGDRTPFSRLSPMNLQFTP